MIENSVQISGALKTNLETIKAYICLGRARGHTDKVIIREACNNVYNYVMRSELNEMGVSVALNCLHSGYYWMSKNRFKLWEQGTRTGGIKEHVVPFKVIRGHIEKIIDEGGDLLEIYNYLKKVLKVVWITDDEEEALNTDGFRARVPADGNNRHQKVGIEWHDKPVLTRRVRADINA